MNVFPIKCTFWYCAPVFCGSDQASFSIAQKEICPELLRVEIFTISVNGTNTLKMKFSFTAFFIKCDQIRSCPYIWSHLLKKSLMESVIFLCSVLSCHQTFMLAREFPQALKSKFCWICYHFISFPCTSFASVSYA